MPVIYNPFAILRPNPVFWILLTNLIPLVGVLFLNWSPFEVVILFWFETIFIGFFNFFKIILARGLSQDKRLRPGNLGTALFFCVHFGGFCLGQGLFILLGLAPKGEDLVAINWLQFQFALLFIFINVMSSFFQNYIATKAYENTQPVTQLFSPYGRIFLQQIIAVGGGFLAIRINGSHQILLVAAIVVLKTVMDLIVYFINKNFGNKKMKPATGAGSI